MLASIDLVFGFSKANKRTNTRQGLRGWVELIKGSLAPCEAEINFKLLPNVESVLTKTQCQAGASALKEMSIQSRGSGKTPFF